MNGWMVLPTHLPSLSKVDSWLFTYIEVLTSEIVFQYLVLMIGRKQPLSFLGSLSCFLCHYLHSITPSPSKQF